MSDTKTPKVTGIGGIFFFSDDPKKTCEWYSKNLGLEIDEWGSPFEFRNANRPDEINYLRWSPFKAGSDYFKSRSWSITEFRTLTDSLRNCGQTA
jgi:hypothetical protein